MQTVDFRQLFLRHSRQFWQGSVSIWHSLFQISRVVLYSSGSGGSLIHHGVDVVPARTLILAILTVVELLHLDVEGEGGNSPVLRAPQLFQRDS